MEREFRYCVSEDGTRLAYCVLGEGPVVVDCPAVWEPFTIAFGDSTAVHGFERGRTVVRYDFRGVGLSQRDPPSFTHERFVEDLEAVVKAAGLNRFSVRASHFSVSAAIEFAVRHPEQVQRLILDRVFTRGEDVMPRANVDALVALMRTNWQLATQVLADMSGGRAEDPNLGVRMSEVYRKNADGDAAARMVSDLYDSVDVTGILEDVKCPTLIMHRSEDAPFSFASAQDAAARIPLARLIAPPGSGSTTVGSDSAANIQAEIDFLDEDPETRALMIEAPATVSASAFRTVLFTDLVGHTEMMSRLGDERGREVLREHERITREVLKANGGTEVKTMGDGFMASFGSVTRAVECAIALQRAFAEREGEPLNVRVGLNAGEPIEEDGDLFGATVILASRIAAKAEGGEILVADTVRGLCIGQGVLVRGQRGVRGEGDRGAGADV